MTWLIGWALRFRLLIVAVAVGVMATGFVLLQRASVDVLPEFSPTYAEIQTEALGLSAEEVEQLITVPLEADLLNGVEGVEVIRSESLPGLSSITMVFVPGTDVYRGRQLIEERLTQAHALPNVSKPPTLLQPMSSSNRVLMIGMSSDELNEIQQSVIARWTVRPRLMGVEGVANVAVWGMRDQQLQVQVDPERLREHGVTLGQVIETAGNAQVVSPLSFLEASTPGTGGYVETPQQRLQVRHLIEKIADPEELGKVPVHGTGGRLRLSQVADVVVGHQPLIGDAIVNGGPGVMLVVEKLPDASTAAVTERVEDALETLQPGLTTLSMDTSVFRPVAYIEDSLRNLGIGLLIGGGLMLLALAAIRHRWRSLAIVAVTVPLAMVAAALALYLMGQSFNAITLAGLAAAVVIVVDTAVVPTDLIHRRLRDPDRRGSDAGVAAVVRQTIGEVHRPLTYATVIVLLAVVPVAVMAGRPGAFFAPLVWGYVLAVLAAMLVALTVTPALAVLLFSPTLPTREPTAAGRALQRADQKVRARYLAALRSFSSRLRIALVATLAIAIVGLGALPFLGTSLIPTFHDPNILVRLDASPGTSNPRMTEITTDVTKKLRAVPGVANVGAHVGRSVTGDRLINVNSSDVWVALKSDADFDGTMDAIRDTLAATRGVEHEVVTYSAQKIRDVGAVRSGANDVTGDGLSLLTGLSQPVVVRLFGQDPDILRREAQRVQQMIADIDGVVDPTVELPATQPTVEIEVDLEKAQGFGVTPGDIRRAEATLLQGIQVGSVFEEQKVFDVVVQGAPVTRGSVSDIENLLIDRPGGGYLRLGQVADVRVVDTASVIKRDAVSRRLDVQAGVSGRSVDSVLSEIDERLAELSFPLEYHAEVMRGTTGDEVGYGRVIGFAVGALIAVFLLLQAVFRSWRLASLVLVLIPVSLVGAVVATLFMGADVTLGTLVGLLAVFGLAVRANLLLIEEIRWRERDFSDDSWTDKVLRGARARLGSVGASAAALTFLALPFVVLGTRPGLEVLHPMAVTLIGGLVTTAFVTLFVLPSLYLHVMVAEERAEPDERTPSEPASTVEEPRIMQQRGSGYVVSRTEIAES